MELRTAFNDQKNAVLSTITKWPNLQNSCVFGFTAYVLLLRSPSNLDGEIKKQFEQQTRYVSLPAAKQASS